MKYCSEQLTFYFHDYETFGTHPALDRPAQFAGVRTDEDFNIIEEPLVIYCCQAQDYLPNPEAVLITGITPQEANQKGICEAEFTRLIHQAFSESNTCILGYNNIRFDDEVTRNILYRNFYDPYAYCWQNGNSRWDLLDVVRACYALRPEGINWPINDEGLPSFRLQHLTEANNIKHEQAHDAMSDVYATIAMAKLIKEKQPKLFNYFFSLRKKNKVAELIDVVNMTPLVHVSGMLGSHRGNLSLVAPIIWHPVQNHSAVICDLTGDIDLLINLSVEEIKEKLYTKTEDLQLGESRVPLKLVHTNKCPILAPLKTLLSENAKRFNIDIEQCLINQQKLLQNHKLLQNKMQALFNIDDNSSVNAIRSDVDTQIYGKFFNNQDKLRCEIIRTTPVHLLDSLSLTFDDPRLATLFFRYKARNYPQTLTEHELIIWQDYCRDKFNTQKIEDYLLTLEQLAENYIHQQEKLAIIKQLYHYCYYLVGN
ncbi:MULTISPECIES: exodeoxyribonuclease I [unclassified Gilliamella]|uniref:exodeoxyribonuclease I n=1 Tax=unclassified Gilliamella TaxID=2685620 RepID=UPI00080E46E6|nr:exodeoxyribonuclease I [Gilliamella apicola]OCG19197.1 exodeoxyribonuclease I [Gilliamella apicola]OCG20245.1 exodeoxyribonuclease I [Gilliamella apicola]